VDHSDGEDLGDLSNVAGSSASMSTPVVMTVLV
jgi:hypothetical protein